MQRNMTPDEIEVINEFKNGYDKLENVKYEVIENKEKPNTVYHQLIQFQQIIIQQQMQQ